ncbi:hypothetical protein V8J82_05935 [Gymnodinialimonas sp. 2305UL16-5]|uniref:hypothetical protein n=1 Tax=Gymnodinialimonas mytili TaxID=3126503 RepID=UPI003094BAB6
MDPNASLTPTSPLDAGEHVIAQFRADKATYWRTNAWVAAFAMAAGMGILWVLGNPHVWTGAVGGLAAIAVRALYLASDDLHMRWDLTNQRLLGPGTREISLESIAQLNAVSSMVQVVTIAGDKHLIKNQPDPGTVIAAIEDARP